MPQYLSFNNYHAENSNNLFHTIVQSQVLKPYFLKRGMTWNDLQPAKKRHRTTTNEQNLRGNQFFSLTRFPATI